jgi:2-oxoglutarate ferredoxin oxidoreductase subunit alpha
MAIVPAEALLHAIPAIEYCAAAEIPLVIVADASQTVSGRMVGFRDYWRLGGAFGAPLIQLFPADVTQCFQAVQDAANFAEQSQTPVLVHLDRRLGQSIMTCAPSLAEAAIVDRGQLLRGRQTGGTEYQRYAHTESGISPRKLPGQPGVPFVTEARQNTPSSTKRQKKLSALSFPVPYLLHGPVGARVTILAHGDATSPSLRAAAQLTADGIPANVLQLYLIRPLPDELLGTYFRQAHHLFVAESGPAPDLVSVLRDGTGHALVHAICPSTGTRLQARNLTTYIRDFVTHI